MESLGKRLKKVMIDHNHTQKTLSIETGFTQATISRILNDKTPPSYRMMQKLQGIFNLSLEFFDSKYEPSENSNIIKEDALEYKKRSLIDISFLEEKIQDLERRIYDLEASKS